ncbi:DUF7282 domain-containing protein [Natronosalvus rutilus]|uniref:DUF7282 domain-containing protein n=1 Tax=Natronosalvus rutilus TaxID=2953753 RepID=A0A9E7NDN9_9EURY|nr:hypothetical protein [Natronosalvus rutilus]UTF55039.1 hypothetical protein NGM29_07245 [Natronosalvus rutilus]
MSTRKHVVVVLVALMMLTSGVALVGAASASSGTSLAIQDDETNDTENDTENDTSEADNETTQPSASVTFSDQTTDGTSVVVDEVTMEEGGFVTIHDSSLLVGNVIESVLGTSEYLEAGTHEDVEVQLDTSLEESETLIAMPHLDTNDNETYDFVETEGEDDGPYLTEDGEPVTDEAAVTLESAEEPANETDDVDDSEADNETDDAEDEKPSECPVEEEDDGDDAEAEPPADDADEEPANDSDDAPVMEPDADAVEDGVTIVNANFSEVTIEEVTIENVYILVLDDEEALDRLEEMLGDEENVTVVDGEDEMDGVDDNETDDGLDDETDVGDDDDMDDNETDDETDVGDDDDMDDNETDDGLDDNETDDEADDGLDDNETDVGDDDDMDDNETDVGDDNETDAGVGDGDDMDDNETDVGDGDMESFTVENLEAPENATVGDTITVNATVTNPNDEEATQDVEFRLQGNLVESQSVTLDADSSDTVEFEVDTTGVEAGEYVHMVLTDEFGEVAFIELIEEDEMDDTETDEDDADDNETDADDNDTDETDDYDDNETDDNETDDTDTDSRIPIGVVGLV